MTASQSLYLDQLPDPAFVTIHRPLPEVARDTAVMLCPPFGWDEVCSYRSLRSWAERLADDGYPTLRLSLPSTGDSGGTVREPGRVDAWTQAIDAASRWLAAETGAARVAAIGIGLGGLLTVLATARGAPVDELVLWGVPARGRSLLRHVRAFSKLEVTRFFEGLAEPPPLPPGELEAGGFLLSAETVSELESLDLAALPRFDGLPRRALLLERDGLAVDDKLREHLTASIAEVEIAPGPGYGAMTSHPQQARPPLELIARVSEWLGGASELMGPTIRPPDLAAGAADSAEIRLPDGNGVRETPVVIAQDFGSLSGVLVEPLQPPGHQLRVLLLNAGAVRRIGPSRMWVQCARRWATQGLTTLRLDVEGIGDADGDADPYAQDAGLYVPELVPQVLSAIDFLEARGEGQRFVLCGLCAGAYWSFHGALRDARVCAAVMVNPRALIWDTGLGPARDLRAVFSSRFSPARVRRVATGPRVRALLRWFLSAPLRSVRRLASGTSAAARTEHELDGALDQLLLSGKRALFLFSAREPVDEELVRTGRAEKLAPWPAVSVERIAVRDHTMRPIWAQQQAQAALDRAIRAELDRELARVPGAEPVAGAGVDPTSRQA